MHRGIKKFVEVCVETLPITEPIYEFGSFRVPGQNSVADLRPLFSNRKYIGADMREGTGVDIILDLHNIDLPSDSVGTILILDTLEHVEFPRKAIGEVYRVLKPDGILIVSSVMCFPIHNYPHDYWRFTPEAFKSLLEPFLSSFVDFAGVRSFPHTVVGIGVKGLISQTTMDRFIKRLKATRPLKSSWESLAALYVPPILWPVYQKLRRLFNG